MNDAEVFAAILETGDTAAVGEAIARRAVAEVEAIAERIDEDLEQETVAAASSNVIAVSQGLVDGIPAHEISVPQETLAWASTLVQRGVGASAIPRCYLVGQALLDDFYRAELQAQDLSAERKWELAATFSQYLLTYVSNACAGLVEHYERERDRWVRGADSVRTELVLGMVDGRPFDAAAVSATLRYELDREHLALIVWADPDLDTPPSVNELKRAAADASRALGGLELLVLPASQQVVWAWATGTVTDDGPPVGLDPRFRVATGSVGTGADGFIASHHEARRARRMAETLDRSVTHYRAVELASLLTTDREAADRFVVRELGPLSDDSDASRRLRATLVVLFDERGSWGRAAQRLGIHQNTVMYRARQAEELLGHPLGERRLELEVALRLANPAPSP